MYFTIFVGSEEITPVIVEPGVAQPHTGAGRSRCKIILSPNTLDRLNAVEVLATERSKTTADVTIPRKFFY